MPPVSGSSVPRLFTISVDKEDLSSLGARVISPVTFSPVNPFKVGLSDRIVWSAVTLNVIGAIVLYPAGVVVSVNLYSPSSRPLKVKRVAVFSVLSLTDVTFPSASSSSVIFLVTSA